MSKEKIRWGILGCGSISDKFARTLAGVKDSVITGVGSRDHKKAAQFKETLNLKEAKVYGCYEDLAAVADIDVVYIGTPHNLHMENSIMVMETGKAVLCEKPIAVNASQTRAMIKKAKEKKVFFMEAMWTRFMPLIEQVKAVIDSKSIGEITSIKAEFCIKPPRDVNGRLFNANLAGGALLDLGIYPLFLTKYLMDMDPIKTTSLAVIGDTKVDEDVFLICQFPDDIRAYLFASLNFSSDNKAIIVCQDGEIHIPNFFMPTSAEIRKGKKVIKRLTGTPSYCYEAQEVTACLKNNLDESPRMPLNFSLELSLLMEKIRAQIGLKYPFEK